MQNNEHNLFKWEGPLDARKIIERIIAGIIVGLAMGVGFYLMGAVFG